MGMFTDLLNKIMGHGPQQPSASAPTPPQPPASTPAMVAAAANTVASPSAPVPTQAAAAAGQQIDVTGILNGLAAKNPEHLDWKRSIVDLLKLVGMDSSLSARKELATELHYTGDKDDSATMNVWLHKEVLKKLAAHGGTVPPELLG